MITFFTCCNKSYQKFIPLFISSILFHNSDAAVEIGVEDLSDDVKTLECIEKLKLKYPSKILIRDVKFSNATIMPNAIRFITEPITKNKFVYILDIDIITLEKNITQIHEEYMIKNNVEYINIVRKNSMNTPRVRLTGCHFSKWENYYPIPNLDHLKKSNIFFHDEVLLHYIVSQKNVIRSDLNFRPIHGIHVSPNRKLEQVGNTPGWGFMKNWKPLWKEYRNSEEFFLVESYLKEDMLDIIKQIDHHSEK